MALDSFVRDFGLLDATQSKRDEVQSYIVSTFYASLLSNLSNIAFIEIEYGTDLMASRLVAFSARY